MALPHIIFEKKPTYIDHDRLFKQLIQAFFEEFLKAFFPNEHGIIDFSKVKFLEQEVFTDIIKGEKRQIDILAETKQKNSNQLILIHIEPQATHQHDFNERMFIYCSRLYEKFRKPIIPIAVFSYEDVRDIPNKFTLSTPTLEVIQFNYLQLHLIKLNWRKYLAQDNPAAAALLSKMGYTDEERVQVKLEFLRMITRMELNPAKMELLYGFFDTYLKLNETEEQEMDKEISKLPKDEADRVMELPNSYIERGRKEGIRELVLNMIKKGVSHDFIAEVAEIDIEEIEKIKKEAEVNGESNN